MRYGCCINMVTKTHNVSGTDVVPVLKTLGFDYAELSLSHICAMSDSEFYELKSTLSDTGLPTEVCNNFFPSVIKLTGPSIDMDTIKRYLDLAFQRSQALGIKLIVFGSGPARQVPDGFSSGEAIDQLAGLLRLINKYAVETGITIGIEPLRHQECNIVNTYGEALALKKMSDVPQVSCLLDYYHMVEENESISVIHSDSKSIAHVHFSEPVGRVFPLMGKKMQYLTLFSNLRQAGYDQRISIEAYSNNLVDDSRNALKLLNEIEWELNLNLN